MSNEADIFLEDGTLWDGSDPEEPFLHRRLHLCQSCRNIVASPERIEALLGKYMICNGSREGDGEGGDEVSLPCAMRAIALTVVEGLKGGFPFPGQTGTKREDIEDPSKLKFFLEGQARRGEKYDITTVKLCAGRVGCIMKFDISAFPGEETLSISLVSPAHPSIILCLDGKGVSTDKITPQRTRPPGT